jgi:predicted RNA-binding Zn-ribbon protein involved in translation (DUF1610 family)
VTDQRQMLEPLIREMPSGFYCAECGEQVFSREDLTRWQNHSDYCKTARAVKKREHELESGVKK